MTGIERLHKLIADIDVSADPELWYILRGGTEGDWDCEEHDDKTLGSTLAAIADQIEREQGGRVSRMRVLAVVTEMERHVSGVEGMEDSPVARWSRELREALGGDGLENEGGCKFRQTPDEFTHTKPEPPDSWERIEEDLTLSPEVYCHRNGIDISQKDGTEIFLADTVDPMARDLVRRARALAERERSE